MKTTVVVESLSSFKTNVLFQRMPTFFKINSTDEKSTPKRRSDFSSASAPNAKSEPLRRTCQNVKEARLFYLKADHVM